jgi:hypothetical protein
MMQGISVVGLFCEDIREERAGTDTIIGILPDNINFPQWPAFFPKLCLYVRIHVIPSFEPGQISVHLVMPDGTEPGKIDLDPDLVKKTREAALASKAPTAGFISKFVMSPLQLSGPGRIQAVAHVGHQRIVCGSLYVNVEPQVKTT